MSSTFERIKTVIDIGPRYENSSDHDLLAFAYYADSNVFPKTYDPMFIGFGWKYNIIGEIGRLIGEVEGGMLKPGGRYTSAEGYIRAWRKAMKEATSLDEFLKRYPGFTIVTYLDKEKYEEWMPGQTADEMKKKSYDYGKMIGYLDHENTTATPRQRWEEDYIDVERTIKTADDVREAIQFNRMAMNAGLAKNWKPQLRGVGTY